MSKTAFKIVLLVLLVLLALGLKAISGFLASNPGVIVGACVLFLLVIALIAIFDKGMSGLKKCTLQRYKLKPDQCVSKGCQFTCHSIKGPYPKWAPWTPFTQDVLCLCPTNLNTALGNNIPPIFSTLINAALSAKGISELMREVEAELTENGIDSDRAAKLIEILQKKQRNEELTPEEEDLVKQFFPPDYEEGD